jgi:hypothetical protein
MSGPQTKAAGPPVCTKCGGAFRRYFKCCWTGKVYDAWDYGHWAWPIGCRCRRKR